MDEFSPERSRSWNIYGSSDPTSPSQPGIITREAPPLKNIGSSMNAISFGFVATAILISMFLIMAIFEHLFRPTNPAFSEDVTDVSNMESGSIEKPRQSQSVQTSSYASDFSVVMPGERYPTFIAQPAPLPCTRERVYWPSHEGHFVFPRA